MRLYGFQVQQDGLVSSAQSVGLSCTLEPHIGDTLPACWGAYFRSSSGGQECLGRIRQRELGGGSGSLAGPHAEDSVF